MESAKWYIARLHARERAAASALREQQKLKEQLSLTCGKNLRVDWHVDPVSPTVSVSSADSRSVHENNHAPAELDLPSVPKTDPKEERDRGRTREAIVG